MNKKQNAQVSDTTKPNACSKAGNKKIFFLLNSYAN